ncbi:MAG: DsrE family protein, partial [Gammaproteobacteria bacterium]|nr:DsrE family protein [Gammaproteobacteria bacterium]
MNNKTLSGKKLLIIMSNSDPAKPEGCYAPLFQATIAAALSHEVEVVLTGVSGQLAIAGVAEKVEMNLDTHSTLYDIIQEAHSAGVSFKACNTSLKMAGEDLIAEVEEKVGAAYVIDEAMD